MRKSINYKRTGRVDWVKAADIEKRVKDLIATLDLSWVKKKNVHCFRSKYSKTRAAARIWGLSRIWQKALETEPSYIIEVISEKFDKLSKTDQDKILLHEIAHIPKNFSGSLVPHFRKGKRKFSDRIRTLVAIYNESNSATR